MSTETPDERWKQLCKAILEEPDPNRMLDLVIRLNRALEEKEKRARARPVNPGGAEEGRRRGAA